MANVNYRGITYNVVFIDPSKTDSSGDGTSVAQALQTFPSSLTNNTCYLIRRTSEDSEAFVNHEVNTNLVNIMFLGMPKATDEQWIQDLITDSDANSQWKGDSASYANVRFWHRQDGTDTSSPNRACINAANLDTLAIINCYCYRGQAAYGSTNTNYHYYISPMFANNNVNNTYELFVLLTNCKFGTKDADLSNPSVYADKASIAEFNVDNSTQAYAEYSRGYLSFRSGNKFIVDNCVINNTPFFTDSANPHTNTNSQNYLNSAFTLSNFYTVSIRDCKVYQCMASSVSTSGCNQCFWIMDGQHLSIANIENTVIANSYGLCRTVFVDSTSTNYNSLVRVNISNITVKFDKFGEDTLGKARPSNVTCGVFCNALNAAVSRINGFFLDASSGVKLSQIWCFNDYGRGQNNGAPFTREVNNINIKLARASDGDCYYNKGTAVSVMAINGSTVNNPDDTYSEGNVSNENSNYRRKTTDVPVWKNINVYAPDCYLWVIRGVFNSASEYTCGLRVEYSASVDIAKLVCTDIVDEVAINILEGSYARIRDLVAFNSARSSALVKMNSYNSTCLYIDKSDIDLTDNATYGNSSDSSYYNSQLCVTNMKETGRLFVRNRNTFAQSWGVSRTGSSSSACLKLNSNVATYYNPLRVGGEPFKGFSLTPSKTGKQKLKAYFAYKGFVESDEFTGHQQFKLAILVPRKDDNDISYVDVYSSTEGEWLDDSSVWSDSDYTSKVMEIPVEITTLDPLDIKVEYAWYKDGSLVYLDPVFELAD